MAELPRPSGTHQPLSGEPGPSNFQILNSNEGKPESPTSVTQTPSPTPSRIISHPILKTQPTIVTREALPVVPAQVGPIQTHKPRPVPKTAEQSTFDIELFEKGYLTRLHPDIASALAKNANKLLFRPPTKDKKVAEKTPRNTRLIDDISLKAALDLLISQGNLSDARKKEIAKLYSKDCGCKIGQIFSLLKLDPKKPLPTLKDTLIDSEAPISFNFLPANPAALVQQQAKDIIGKPELLAFMRLPYNKARTMELTKALNTHRINSDSDDGLDDVQSIVSQTQHPLLPFVRLELFLTRQGVGADLILEIVSRLTRDPKVQFELAGINPMIDKAKEKGGIPWPKIIGGVVTTVIAIPTINLVSAMYRGGVTYEATKTANPVTIHVNPAQTGTNPDGSPKLESLITTTDPKIIVVDSKGKPGTNTNNDIFAKSQLTTTSYAVVITSPEGNRVSLSDIKRKVTVKLAEQGINGVDIGPLSNGLYGVTLGNQNQLGAVTSVLTDLKVGEVTLEPADGTTSATTSQQSLLEQAQDKLGDNTRAKENEIHSKNAGIAALASGAIALLIFGINKGLKKLEDRSKQSNIPKGSDQR